jgi:hypothetical protein
MWDNLVENALNAKACCTTRDMVKDRLEIPLDF